jgi:hypothetical protein
VIFLILLYGRNNPPLSFGTVFAMEEEVEWESRLVMPWINPKTDI